LIVDLTSGPALGSSPFLPKGSSSGAPAGGSWAASDSASVPTAHAAAKILSENGQEWVVEFDMSQLVRASGMCVV
jgi:hypothetical protein